MALCVVISVIVSVPSVMFSVSVPQGSEPVTQQVPAV